ncbi:MAG: SpoIIE family protein phosphatase [Nitrospira sp.]|nr:SpoIIE family protein phosphatase [Nitrospira sp.]
MSSPFSLASEDPPVEAVPPTVLIVDDESVARIALTARLKRLGYRVLEACDGRAGLELLRRERPALTILDWLMPEMDGPSFCEVVRRDPALRSSQILMMTAHDEPKQIAEGLARGADDFLRKAASPEEITARVQSGLRAATLIRTLEQTTEDIRRKQDLLEQELKSAAQYVASLLPTPGQVLPGVHLAYSYRPALTLGGDLFNVLQWGGQEIGLYLLDASGHGVSPALRSASLGTFLRSDSLQHQVGSRDPGAILTAANELFPLTADGHYFTIIFARLDLCSRTLSFASAGHNGAFLHRRSGEVVWLRNPGLPLGFCVPETYRTIDVSLSPGDRLYFVSDGLYEVAAPSGELWGPERLVETVRTLGFRPLTEVVSLTVAQAMQWLERDQFADDAALIGIELAV